MKMWLSILCLQLQFLTAKCINSIDYAITISDQCTAMQLCSIDNSYNGYCKAINYYIDLQVKFPGDSCDETSWTEEWSYGTQKWKDGVWESVGHDGLCSESKDCPVYQYWAGSSGNNSVGVCTQFKQMGEPCDYQYEWGRLGTWWWNDSSSLKGVWQSYFQIGSGDKVNKVYNQFGTRTQYAADSNLLWSSQYYDPATGIWSDGVTSTRKGKECKYAN